MPKRARGNVHLKVASPPDLRCDSIKIASHSVDTTMDCSSNSSTCGVQQQSQAAASTDAAACMMDLLLPDTILKILKLLWDTPESIIAFSLTCSQAQQLCSDCLLWDGLCRSITDTLPGPLRRVDWRPAAWGVSSHMKLYIRLLQPYRVLLQQQVWHTTKMPAGQLLVWDADPPFVWGRSVYFRSLQGLPFAHEVFVISLPRSSKGKAEVECHLCAPLESSLALERIPYALWSTHDSDSSLSPVTRLQMASLTPAAGTGAAAATATATAISRDGAVCTQAATGSNPSRSSGSPADAASCAVLFVCCKSTCGHLYSEQMARWNFGRLYHKYAARYQTGSATGAGAGAGAGVGSSAAAGGAAAGAGGAAAGAAAGAGATGAGASNRSNSGSSSAMGLLPLPDVDTYPAEDAGGGSYMSALALWEDQNFEDVDDQRDCQELSKEFRSQAVYAPFNPGLWLQPYTPSPLSAAQASLTHSSHAGVAGSSGSVLQRGSCQPATPTPPPPSPAAATAATAAEELTGLWRGTYAHGVELVLLQLLQAPPGYDMWQQHQLAQPPPSDLDDCLPGRLLQALLHQPQAAAGHSVGGQGEEEQQQQQQDQSMDGSSNGSHQLLPAAIEAAASAVLEADSTHALQDHNQAPAAAAVAAGASAGNVSGSSLLQQQEEQHAGMEEGAFQSQQLLLVGSKVTGDRHVPAGQVTFAVDLGSRSREGAGQLLQLPAGVRTAVEVNGPGTRPLVLKERYHGMAQIAGTNFKDPRITPVELIVFEDPACLGVLWAPPMQYNNFSFFVRQIGLP